MLSVGMQYQCCISNKRDTVVFSKKSVSFNVESHEQETPGESRIPVFCSTSKPLTSRLSRPLANLSSKVRAHLSSSDSSTKHRSPSSSMLFGILAGQNSRSKSSKSSSRGSPTPSQSSGQSYNERPLRPSRFFQSLNGNDLSNLKDLKEKKLEASISSAHIGQKVCVAGQKIGVLRYYGKIESDGGWWCGVELDEPYGVNDGSVRGVRYFNCPPQHGLLTPESKVSLVVKDEVKEYISDVSDSGPHSLLGLTQEINSTGDKKHAETTYVVENGWCSEEVVSSSDQNCSGTANVQSASQLSTPTPGSTCSGGIPIWEWTIGSQHSSSAGSLVPSVRGLTLQDPSQASLQLSKHSSFELDESLGILTPDQMADFTMNSAIEGSLHRTPSSEDAPSFLLLDFEDDKMLDLLTNPNSKRSSLEMQYEETPTQVPPSQQAQMIHNSNSDQSCDVNTEKDATIICRDNYNNDVTMKDSDDTIRDQLMEQDAVCKDLSEDTEMSESHASKKTSDIAMSYEISTETPSNSERAELIRINRTPSLEDLPLDKVDVVELCATVAGPSRSVLPAPTSFVTSVTSITSLDNGYQGDGEWSRPASRGADHSPSAHQAVKVKPMDPMTDSDFFTESDADMHDDLSTQAGSGTCRGDRRAQVIDGTLYGGVSGGTMQNNNSAVYLQHHQSNQRCPSFTPTNTEEMDSSGIYSDLERRNEEPVSDGGKSTMDDNVVNEQQNEKDLSPDGSTRTASSKSENSQTRMTPADFTALIMEQMNTIKNLAIPRPMEDQAISCNIMTIDEDGYHSVVHMNGETLHNEVLTEKSVNEAKDSVNNNNNNNCTKKTNATKDEHVIKKYKMPKRNVVSKIKTMISSSAANNNNNNNNKKDGGEDENQENRRPGEKPGKAAKKGGRWDAVMNKIAQGKAEEKTKPSRLKEVKSKVFAGISLEPAAAQMPRNGNLQSANSRKLTSARNLTATQSVSTRSLRDVTSLKMKSRRSRTRGSECSLQVSGKSAASQTSSRNSSLSDVSLNVSPALSKVSPQSVRSNKKREPGRSTSPQSDGSNNSASRHPTAVSTLPHARPLPQKNGNKVVTEKKTSPNRRKQPPRQAAYEPPVERDLNRVTGSGHRVGASKTDSPQCRPHELPVLPPPPTTALKPSPPPLPDYALPRLQHATAGFHALTVLVNHLVFNLDAFSTPSLKKELERMRADWLKTKLDLDEVRISYTRSEEEKKAYEQRLQDAQYELQAHNKHRQELSSILRDQEVVVQELQQRISIQAEELTCREQEITNLKESHSQEVAALKKTAQEEVAAKEAEMQERLDVVTKKYEEVKAQSQTLLETLHADKDSKLQVTLGRCKMLEDEVKSLNAVLELRIGELQDLRRQYEIAQHDAQQLPAALQKNSVLQLKIEDLEAQLERKSTAEQILSQENRLLAESIQQEAKQKKRLSQHNEELQWKLKQNSEVVSALAALSGVSDISAHKRGPVHIHLAPKTPIQCHTDLQVNAVRSQQLPSTSNHKETSPPQSPKVYAVVEKSDSVSWVLEMDESPEDVASRLVRRAHSFRAVHSATPSPAHHSRTLPNPHKRQRSRTSSSVSVISSKPPRMRSFSLDSDNSDVPRKTVANWDDSVSHPTRLKPIVNSNNHINDNEDSIVVETVGDDPLHGFLDLDVQIDAEKLEVMGGEDFASPKMSSSSGDSEASVRSRRNETKTLDPEEIMVINSDHGWISLPKESGGEAMISEETTDTDSTSSDSDEDHSCSEDESLSGSASELIERRNKLYLERKIKMELKQQGVVDCSSKNSELKPAITTVLLSDSGSVSAATTAMDLSWSEDVELTSSETEV